MAADPAAGGPRAGANSANVGRHFTGRAARTQRFVGTMSEQFQRLGILGTWDKPY
jgi:hypothetical protein